MSAEEMTIDPVFGFNSDLGDVNNIRTATEYILAVTVSHNLRNLSLRHRLD